MHVCIFFEYFHLYLMDKEPTAVTSPGSAWAWLWESYEASETHSWSVRVSLTESPVPKAQEIDKREDTGNNLSLSHWACNAKQWSGGCLSSELWALIRPSIRCKQAMGWRCSVNSKHTHTQTQPTGHAAMHVSHTEERSERASEASLGSKKNNLPTSSTGNTTQNHVQ